MSFCRSSSASRWSTTSCPGGRKFYRPREAFIPVEFQGAVYRFGHTLVRPSYRANLAGDNGEPFFAMIFDPAGEGQDDPVDLRGGARAPRRFIGWQTFFDFGRTFTDGPDNPNPAIRSNKLVDTKHLHPAVPSAARRDPFGRPARSPCRSGTCSVTSPGQLPSGQSIAREMNAAGPVQRGPERTQGFWPAISTSRRRCGTTSSRKPQVMARWPASRAGRRPHRGRSHHRAAATRPAFLSGGRAAVATDAADQEWSGHRRLPDDRLSHLCRRGSHQSRSVGAGGPCGWPPRTCGSPHLRRNFR